jgi:hypothetical protein
MNTATVHASALPRHFLNLLHVLQSGMYSSCPSATRPTETAHTLNLYMLGGCTITSACHACIQWILGDMPRPRTLGDVFCGFTEAYLTYKTPTHQAGPNIAPHATSGSPCLALPHGKKKMSHKGMYQGLGLNPVPRGVSDKNTLVLSHGAGPGVWTLRHQHVAPAWRNHLSALGDARGRHCHARRGRAHRTGVVGPIHHLQRSSQ